MADKPTYAVVIPTFGRPEYLRHAVGSVLEQTDPDLECIVVDDASPEPVVLDDFDDPRLRMLRLNSNRGPAAARNLGVARSAADFVTFLDDDDWYETNRLEAVRPFLDPGRVVISWVRYEWESPLKEGRSLHGDVSDTVLHGMTPHVSGTVVPRSQFLPFAEDLDAWEDVDWWIRMAAHLPVVTVPQNLGVIRQHDGPRDRTSSESRVRSGEIVIERHREYFSSNRRAHAFRLMRLGLTARQMGDETAARHYLFSSLQTRPGLRALRHAIQPRRPDVG